MFTPDYCAIDFGTSNSAIAIPAGGGMRLAALEPGFHTMPTAVFYNAEDESRSFGRAAITAYVEGCDGRLMRSIKSVLGSGLMEQTTEIGHGIAVRYLDVVTGYLRHLKSVAVSQLGRRLQRAIIGRPVCFVDGDPERDAKAQAAYAKAGSRDTVRSRSFTGKPARMLRNEWTEAWETPGNPEPLGMPLQYMVSGMAVAATSRYPDETVDVAFNPVGQVVGQLTKVEKSSAVIERWVQEYLEATNRLNDINEAAST